MADPVWGQLAKAQDDPETIEEAINAAILAHESDPEAHLGEGESLESHRAFGVLDHPQASVVMDKFSSTEAYFSSSFENITPWSDSGSVSNSNWPGVTLEVADGDVETSYLRTTPLVPGGFLRAGKDAMFECSLYLDEVDDVSQFALGFGAEDLSPTAGFGFVKDEAEVRGFIRVGSTTEYTDDLGIDMHSQHSLRAFYSGVEDIIYFYVDGVLVDQITRPSGTWNISPWLYFWYNANGEESGIMKVLYTVFASDLSPTS